MIRQSAIYRKGRNAVDTAGGVVPHTGSGPVPTFVFFGDVQAGQDRGQQVANGTGASTTLRTLLQHTRDNLGFMTTRVIRQLADGCVQVSQQAIDWCLMILMKAS